MFYYCLIVQFLVALTSAPEGGQFIMFPVAENPPENLAPKIEENLPPQIQSIPAPKIPVEEFHCETNDILIYHSGILNGEEFSIYHWNKTVEKFASEGFEITVQKMFGDAIDSFTASNGTYTITYGFSQHSGVGAATVGEPAKKTRGYYMAQLGLRRKDDIIWLCDGALINREWILTAAHCFLNHGQEPDLVRLGDYDLNEPVDQTSNPFGKLVFDYAMADVVFHPDFTLEESYHDLALIRIPRKSPLFSTSINPACLPWDSLTNRNFVGNNLILTGWGATEYGGPKTALLQQLELEVFSTSVCNESYSSLRDFRKRYPQGMDDETIMCVGSQTGKDACGGDSGAPIVYTERKQYIIAGIVLGGYGCGIKEYPGLYIPISKPKYLQWIKEVAFQEYI